MPVEDLSAEPIGLPRREASADVAMRVPVEMLVSDFLDAMRAGQSPAIEEYIARYPQHADELRELLPLVTAMEEWKADKQEAQPPRVLPQSFNIHRLGDCRIIREIGRGGMGVVFEGYQESLGRRVAVKLLPWRFGRDELWRQRFQREARLAAGLRHSNIVPVFRFGEYQGFCYYVMPFIVGMGLDWVIDRLRQGDGAVDAEEIEQARMGTGVYGDESREADSGLPDEDYAVRVEHPDTNERHERQLAAGSWKKFAKIGAQAAGALKYAHGRGLLHRDIKPANLLLDTRGTVWVTDFGLAQPIEQVSQSPSVAGTLRYMPPEQLDGRADERSDVYALGLTLYELLTLRHAFDGESRVQLMRQIRAGDVTPVQEVNREIPPPLAEVIMKSIATDPDHRFPSAEAMATELLHLINPAARDVAPQGWLKRLIGQRHET